MSVFRRKDVRDYSWSLYDELKTALSTQGIKLEVCSCLGLISFSLRDDNPKHLPTYVTVIISSVRNDEDSFTVYMTHGSTPLPYGHLVFEKLSDVEAFTAVASCSDAFFSGVDHFAYRLCDNFTVSVPDTNDTLTAFVKDVLSRIHTIHSAYCTTDDILRAACLTNAGLGLAGLKVDDVKGH